MLDIRIEGHSVELAPGMALTLEKYNPLLDFATVQGSRVYGFQLPDTPKNRRVMGHFYDPHVSYKNRKFFCEKYVDSQLIERGYVMIQEATKDGWSLYFTQNLGEIFGDLQTLSLSDIDFGPLPAVPVAAVDHLTAAACFPTIQNAGFYGNLAVSGFDGKVNSYSAGAYGAAARVPHFFVSWVLKQFGQKVGWKFQGTFLQDPDAQRLVLANLFSLDAAGAITVKNHLPDMTAGGLLIELRKLFNLFLDFDVRRKICDISFVDDILKSQPLIDWTAKAALDWNKIPEVVNRLELAYDIDGNDALLKPIPAHMDKYVTAETPANEGGSTLPVRSRFSTYLTDAGTGLAMTSQAGISPNNKDSQQQGTPKLLFWNGLVGGIPTATAKTATSSLYFQGANSLPARYWKQFERFKGNTFLLRTSLALSPADLATFSFKSKVHIRGVNYLVGALKASLKGDQQAVPVEVELWRV